MAEDFDFEVPPVHEEDESPNRAFITAVAGIGGLLILSLICLGLYTLVIAPRQREARERRPTEIALTNTEIARLLTETAIAGQGPGPGDGTVTATSTTTPTPTEVVVVSTSTPTITHTPEPTEDPQTATAQAQATEDAAAQQPTATATPAAATATATVVPTATPTSTPTELPGTGGFAEDIGVPGMLLLAAVLVAVILVARRLRTRSA
jgi:hypothetical protein